MRVVVVCTDPGVPVFGVKGCSVHAQAVLTELVRAGHEVHLLTPRPGGDATPGLETVRVHLLPAVVGDAPADRERSAVRSDAAVAAVLDGLAPDLVYERYALFGRTASTWASANGVPCVLEVNAPLLQEQSLHRVLVDTATATRVAREALHAATAVVCVSDPVAAWARSLGARRVHVEPNGVDRDLLRRTQARRPDSWFTVGFVGTLRPWHGCETLVDALALLASGAGALGVAGDPGAGRTRLLVVGDGPGRAALDERARRRGVADLVEWTGAVAHHEVPRHLARMDVATAPYPATAQYFSPLKVYEYLAAGVPVVASRVGQLPQALLGGRAGVLVPPGDAWALAAAVARLRRDDALRARLAAAGRAAAQERTWTDVVRRNLAHALAAT